MSLQNPGTPYIGGNLINGIDGIVQTTDDHNSSTGIRRWRKSIYETDLTNWDYGNDLHNVSPNPHNGKNIIHLSFLAPGEDLHGGDSTWAYDKTQWDFNSTKIPKSLQGIHGGGVFTKPGGSFTTNIGTTSHYYNKGVAMEQSHPSSAAGSVGYGGTTKIRDVDMWGYDPIYKSKHDNQWKPWIKADGTTDAAIKSFTTALTNPAGGQKFKFTDDPDETIYTIQRVKEKRIYNHTPWRKMYKHDGSGAIVGTGDSVEEAAVAWRDSATSDAAGDYTDSEAQEWMDRVVNFGKANNRRVCYIIHLEDPAPNQNFPTTPVNFDPTGGTLLNSIDFSAIEFIHEDFNLLDGSVSENPAIWETEPKENTGLDIYYETNQAYPTELSIDNIELFAPIGSKVVIMGNPIVAGTGGAQDGTVVSIDGTAENYLTNWGNGGWNVITVDNGFPNNDGSGNTVSYDGVSIRFIREDGGYTTGKIVQVTPQDASVNLIYSFEIEPTTETGLSWYNCLTFGNGIESDRIRDDFNGMTLSNGVRANATLDKAYKEERRKSGLIYSGLYNSTSGVNNLNQFIAAEKITKDLNPTYGSVQKLFSRRISLIAFCEDRVIGIIANKNALYNADGNPQVVATNAVLGDANPFVGDFGISKNPESFVSESYRAYFTDKQRGAVLRLSKDGLTPISDAGMHDYFRDNLRTSGKLIGTYDSHKNDYNITLTDYLPENLIVNGLLEEGEGGSTEIFDETDLIIDGSFTSGSNVAYPAVPSNVAENSILESTTTITNYNSIGQYTLQPSQAEMIPSNWISGAGGTIYKMNFQTQNPNPQVFGTLPTKPYTSGGTLVPQNNAVGLNGDVVHWDGWVSGDGLVGMGYNTKHTPWFQNSETGSWGGANIRVKLVELGSGLIASGMASSFPNAINPTLFHGEIFKVNLTIQNYGHSSGSNLHTTDNIDFKVELLDNTNALIAPGLFMDSATANNIYDPVTAEGYTIDSRKLGYVNNSSLYQGATTSGIKFSGLPTVGGNIINLSFYFALQGTLGTHFDFTTYNGNSIFQMLDPVVANGFNLRFSNTAGGQKTNRVSIKNVEVKKIRRWTNPGSLTQQDESIGEPPTNILPWAKVEHTAVNGWSASNSNLILNDLAIYTYGPDTGSGETVTYDVYSGGTVTHTDTYLKPPDPNPNGNPPITAYNQYTTTTDVMDGNIVIGTTDDFDHDGRLEASTDGTPGNTAFLTQDISTHFTNGTTGFVLDNWYEVKLTGVNGTGTGILVSDALDPSAFPATVPSPPTGHTLPGHLGTISDDSHKSIKFSDEGSGVWIARWQQKDTSGDLDELKIHFHHFSGTVGGIEFADISGVATGGSANNWSLGGNEPAYHYYSAKTVYYQDGKIRWDNGVGGNYVTQSFSDESSSQGRAQDISNTPKVTEDGYELKFRILYWSGGSLSVYVTAAERNYGTLSNPDRKAYGFEFEGLDVGGYYKVLGNFDGTTAPTIARYESDYTTLANHQPPSLSTSVKTTTNYGHMNKIVFRVPDGGSFNGRIDDVSLVDATNYFTTTNAGSWVFDGFDQTLENYIVFDDANKNILFTNAPDTVSLKQSIPDHDFTTGATTRLKFDATSITSGSISGYFYNSNGEGFTFGPIISDTNFDSESDPAYRLTMGDSTATGGELLNTFVISVDTGDLFSGTLDNFELHRVYPEFIPTTVTYSEDVKGWTSFKSFIPESGVNLSKEYYTLKEGSLYKHHSEDVDRNTFYINEFTESSITTILNAEPSLVKIFNTLNYEGSQSKINLHATQDVFDANGSTVTLSNAEIHNLKVKDGWYVDSVTTDKQSGSIQEFIEKEGKWFNYIKGTGMTETTLPSTADLSFQGLGMVS